MFLKNINKKYVKKNVLTNLNVSFVSSSINALVGLNGSGKSTLLNAITSVITIDDGEIDVDGYAHDDKRAKAKIFYIPSEFLLPDYLSGYEYASYVFDVYGKYSQELFQKLIDILNFSENMNKLICEYSYGMRKKIQIIVAFSLTVKYIICDELLNGLDSESILIVEELIKLKKEKGVTFIIATHELDFVSRIADHVFLIKAGTVRKLPNKIDLRKELSYEISLFPKIKEIERVI